MNNIPIRAGTMMLIIFPACIDLYWSDSRNFSSEQAPHSKQASIAVRSLVPGLKSPRTSLSQPKSYSPQGYDDFTSIESPTFFVAKIGILIDSARVASRIFPSNRFACQTVTASAIQIKFHIILKGFANTIKHFFAPWVHDSSKTSVKEWFSLQSRFLTRYTVYHIRDIFRDFESWPKHSWRHLSKASQ